MYIHIYEYICILTSIYLCKTCLVESKCVQNCAEKHLKLSLRSTFRFAESQAAAHQAQAQAQQGR